jgi:hypothetical protein
MYKLYHNYEAIGDSEIAEPIDYRFDICECLITSKAIA